MSWPREITRRRLRSPLKEAKRIKLSLLLPHAKKEKDVLPTSSMKVNNKSLPKKQCGPKVHHCRAKGHIRPNCFKLKALKGIGKQERSMSNARGDERMEMEMESQEKLL